MPYENPKRDPTYLVDDEYLVTALVPSETACLASSPGRMSRTLCEVSLSREGEVETKLTMFGSLGMKWWTSCCMQRAWRPRWQRVRRCLRRVSESQIVNGWIGMCIPLTKELRMDMARFEIPVSGWTCFRTRNPNVRHGSKVITESA